MAKTNTPAPPVVPLGTWRELYKAASAFQALAPWKWMDDTHVLGINNEHGVRLVSVIGNLGEVFGLASNRGTAGTNFLLRLLRGEYSPENPDAHWHQDALLLDFVPRKSLRKEDLLIMEAIGFQPVSSKPKLFPQYYSHKPGYVPWFIDQAEALQLLDDIRKAHRFAELARDHAAMFVKRRKDEFPFYPDAFTEPLTPEKLVWHIIAPGETPMDPAVDLQALDADKLAQLPQQPQTVWEVDAFYTRMPIGEPPRPYWPKMGLVVDAKSGTALSFQLGTPAHTMTDTAGRCLAQALRACGRRPTTIRVASSNLAQALLRLASLLNIKLVEASTLPRVNEAKRSLEAFGSQ